MNGMKRVLLAALDLEILTLLVGEQSISRQTINLLMLLESRLNPITLNNGKPYVAGIK